jgi:hypothetical protein
VIAAYYALHYGKEWLEWSMRSIREHVDEIHVFYVSRPSHGHQTELICPETGLELRSIADNYDALWWNCSHLHFDWEGNHRDFAVHTLIQRGADTILVVDADEIWPQDHIKQVLDVAEKEGTAINRVFMKHFWRSLKWVCNDEAAPVRVLKPNYVQEPAGPLSPTHIEETYIGGDDKVYHMGYAQTPEIIFYKQKIHGHKGEWRDGWFENIFLPWRPGDDDVHPTNLNFWNPERPDFSTYQQLNLLCGDHPYFDVDLIESTGSLANE